MKRAIALLMFLTAAGLCGCSSNSKTSVEGTIDIRSHVSSTESLSEYISEDNSAEENSSEGNAEEASENEDTELIKKVYDNGGYLVMHTDGSFSAMSRDEAGIYDAMNYTQMLSDESYNSLEEGLYSSKEEYVAKLFEVLPKLEKYFDEKGNLISVPEPVVLIPISEGIEKEDRSISTEKAFYRTGKWVLDYMRNNEETRSGLIDKATEKGVAYTFVGYDWEGSLRISPFMFWSPLDSDEQIVVTDSVSLNN